MGSVSSRIPDPEDVESQIQSQSAVKTNGLILNDMYRAMASMNLEEVKIQAEECEQLCYKCYKFNEHQDKKLDFDLTKIDHEETPSCPILLEGPVPATKKNSMEVVGNTTDEHSSLITSPESPDRGLILFPDTFSSLKKVKNANEEPEEIRSSQFHGYQLGRKENLYVDNIMGTVVPNLDKIENFLLNSEATIQLTEIHSDSEIRAAILNLVELARGEILRIELDKKDGGIFLPPEDVKGVLSLTKWNTLRKLEFCIDWSNPLSLPILCIFTSSIKIPSLNTLKIQQSPTEKDKSAEDIVNFIEFMCKFLFRHKETIQEVDYEITSSFNIPDFSERIAFLRGQLNLEHLKLKSSSYTYYAPLGCAKPEPLGRLHLQHFASTLISGSTSLQSFQLIETRDTWYEYYVYNYDKVGSRVSRLPESLPAREMMSEDLVQMLILKTSPKLKVLSLDLESIDVHCLQNCTHLQKLDMTYFSGKITGMSEQSLNLKSVTEFGLASITISEEFIDWILNQMPNLEIVNIYCTYEWESNVAFGEARLKGWLKFPVLQQINLKNYLHRHHRECGYQKYCDQNPELNFVETKTEWLPIYTIFVRHEPTTVKCREPIYTYCNIS